MGKHIAGAMLSNRSSWLYLTQIRETSSFNHNVTTNLNLNCSRWIKPDKTATPSCPWNPPDLSHHTFAMPKSSHVSSFVNIQIRREHLHAVTRWKWKKIQRVPYMHLHSRLSTTLHRELHHAPSGFELALAAPQLSARSLWNATRVTCTYHFLGVRCNPAGSTLIGNDFFDSSSLLNYQEFTILNGITRIFWRIG